MLAQSSCVCSRCGLLAAGSYPMHARSIVDMVDKMIPNVRIMFLQLLDTCLPLSLVMHYYSHYLVSVVL